MDEQITLSPDREKPPTSELKAQVEQYYDAQQFRLRGNNRVKALERGAMNATRMKLAVGMLKDVEDAIAHDFPPLIKGHPITPWMLSLRGVGPAMTAAIIASGINPEIDKPSAWWRFAGVGVVNGKNQRLRRGEKRSYNGFLNRTLFVMLSQWLRAHREDKPAFYAELYYRFKAESQATRPTLPPIDHHKRAAMLTHRCFLTHLQQRWREALGLPPPRVLYIVEHEPGRHEVIAAP
jgi:hypothetical protein